jgi:Inverse autotransporter, beta-domain
MFGRIPNRMAPQRNSVGAGILLIVTVLVGMDAAFPRLLSAQDPPFRRLATFDSPDEPIAEPIANPTDEVSTDNDKPVPPRKPSRPDAVSASASDITDDEDQPIPRRKPARPRAESESAAADEKYEDRPIPWKKPSGSKVSPALATEESTENEDPIPRKTRRPKVAQASGEFIAPDETMDPASQGMPERVIGNGIGTMGRVSHLGGRTFGRNDSITPLEYMPYLLMDEHFLFADLRGFVTNRSTAGGNFGLGYRRLFDDWNAWGGASVWYDADQSTGKMFQQVGLSFEGLIQQFEVRSNVYLPLTSSQSYSNVISNPALVGNQLLYSRSTNFGNSLRGVDAEIGYSLPILDRHVVRGYVGGYHFEGGSTGGVNGVKARIEGVINNTVTAQTLFTHDKLYGTNLMVGLSMQFPFGKDHPNTGWVRNTPSPFRFVERNYNVIVDQSQTSADNQVAADPTTGKPYLIEQVSSSAGSATPDGTTANPYSTIAAAQAAGGNVILVQSGSVLNQAVTLTSGQHLLGLGPVTQYLPTVGGGSVPIPNLVQAAQRTTPVIQNVTGTAITLASNTDVGGFTITGSTGNGISGTGVSGVSLHDLMFSSIGGDAINLANLSGNVTIFNTQVTSVTGDAIVFNGGNPNINYNGTGNTISANGNGFILENLTGGSVTVNNLALNQIGGTGLIINTVAAPVSVNSLSVTNSGTAGTGGSAVAISGLASTTQTVNGKTTTSYNTYGFGGTTKISSPTGAGFSVNGTDATINVTNLNVTSSSTTSPAVSLVNDTKPITFGSVTVNANGNTGLYADTVTSLQINGGKFTTVGGPAIDVESSGFNALLASVSTNGGPFGIKLASSTGNFSIVGNGATGTGGTIQNTTTAGMLINSFGNTSLSWVNFNNNAVGIKSTGSNQLAVSGLQMTQSTGYAIDSLDDVTVAVNGSTFSGNGAVGGGTIRIQSDNPNPTVTYTSSITKNTITDPNGTAVSLATTVAGAGAKLNLLVSGNTINSYGNHASMIAADWNGPVTASIASNTLNAYGTSLTGILLQDPSTTAILTGSITSNSITFEPATATSTAANSGTAIWVIDGQSGQTSTVTSSVTLTSNAIVFQGTGGTAFRSGFYAPTTNVVSGNTVNDKAGGATGMFFDYVAATSSLEIIQNSITLLKGDTSTNYGFVFAQGAPTFALTYPAGTPSTWTNVLYNLTSPSNAFKMPTGVATGGLEINTTWYAAP